MAAGIVMREAHFPGRAPIDAYGNGGFRFAGMSHRGSILCLPSGIYGWEPAEPGRIAASDLDRLFAEQDAVEVFLAGTGAEIRRLDADLRDRLRTARIAADPMSTGAAVRTYNVLLAEDRAVAAALIAVD
jgi:uncharacterized protein